MTALVAGFLLVMGILATGAVFLFGVAFGTARMDGDGDRVTVVFLGAAAFCFWVGVAVMLSSPA